MKKIIYLLTVVSVLLSCDNNDNLLTSNSEAKVNQILKLNNVNEQKLAYSILLPDEKVVIWKNHLKLMISLNNYNKKQLLFIDNLHNSLSPELISNKSKTNDTFNIKVKTDGLKLFSKQDLFNLIASLTLTSKAQPPPISGCGCSSSSDWCISGDCNGTAYCLRSGDGCGSWFDYGCNGDCM